MEAQEINTPTPEVPSSDVDMNIVGSSSDGFKMTKKHWVILVAIAILVFLYIRYKKKGYLFFPPKAVSDAQKEEKANIITKYDLGEADYRSNGVSVFNIDWDAKTFGYLAVADNESFQGTFEWNPTDDIRKSNTQGQSVSSTGWVFSYGKVPQQSGIEVVSLTLKNDAKKTSFTKIIDFTNKRIS